jgi:Flp pilus assembly protein TadG
MRNLSRPQKGHKNSQRGQSLVELALSLMVILMLLMGAIDFGVALFAYVSMRDAAQDGAIYGSINPTDQTGIKYRSVAAASDVIVIDPSEVTVTINGTACEGSSGSPATPNTLTVSIVHQHPVSTPLVGAMIGSQTITLRAQVTNTILSPVCP